MFNEFWITVFMLGVQLVVMLGLYFSLSIVEKEPPGLLVWCGSSETRSLVISIEVGAERSKTELASIRYNGSVVAGKGKWQWLGYCYMLIEASSTGCGGLTGVDKLLALKG